MSFLQVFSDCWDRRAACFQLFVTSPQIVRIPGQLFFSFAKEGLGVLCCQAAFFQLWGGGLGGALLTGSFFSALGRRAWGCFVDRQLFFSFWEWSRPAFFQVLGSVLEAPGQLFFRIFSACDGWGQIYRSAFFQDFFRIFSGFFQDSSRKNPEKS